MDLRQRWRLLITAAPVAAAMAIAIGTGVSASAAHTAAVHQGHTGRPAADATCKSGFDVWQNMDGYWLNANGNGNPAFTGTNTAYCWSTAAVGAWGPIKTESGLSLGEDSDGAGTELQTYIGTQPQVWKVVSEGNGTYVIINEWSFNQGLIGDLSANSDANGSYINADSATNLRYWQR
jgi:uncharacterized membrane protein